MTHKLTEREAIETLKNAKVCATDSETEKHFDMAINALEKQVAKKPIHYDKHYYKCPICNEELDDDDSFYVYGVPRPNFCCKCGNKFDWE